MRGSGGGFLEVGGAGEGGVDDVGELRGGDAFPEDGPGAFGVVAGGVAFVPLVDGVFGAGTPEEGGLWGAGVVPEFLGEAFAAGFGADGEFGEVFAGGVGFEEDGAAVAGFEMDVGGGAEGDGVFEGFAEGFGDEGGEAVEVEGVGGGVVMDEAAGADDAAHAADGEHFLEEVEGGGDADVELGGVGEPGFGEGEDAGVLGIEGVGVGAAGVVVEDFSAGGVVEHAADAEEVEAAGDAGAEGLDAGPEGGVGGEPDGNLTAGTDVAEAGAPGVVGVVEAEGIEDGVIAVGAEGGGILDGIGAGEDDEGGEFEAEEELEIEGHEVAGLFDGGGVGGDEGEADGAFGLEFAEVKFVFLAASDAVEEEPEGFGEGVHGEGDTGWWGDFTVAGGLKFNDSRRNDLC